MIFNEIIALFKAREPDKGLTATQKLEVREELTRQLADLPVAAVRLIRSEVSSEVKKAEGKYSLAVKVLGVSVVIISGLLAVLIGGSWSDLRKRTEEVIRRSSDVETIQSNLASMYVTAFERHRDLTNRIRELSTMDNVVTAQQLQKAIDRIDRITSQAEEALLATAIVGAQAGDAFSFDRLLFWSTNSSGQVAFQAKQAIDGLLSSITGPFFKPYDRATTTTWDLTLGFESSFNIYRSSLPEARLSVIETIGTATNYTTGERLDFLTTAALTDSTIPGRRFAIDLLNKELKTNFVAWNPTEIREWWRTNKVNYIPRRRSQ